LPGSENALMGYRGARDPSWKHANDGWEDGADEEREGEGDGEGEGGEGKRRRVGRWGV